VDSKSFTVEQAKEAFEYLVSQNTLIGSTWQHINNLQQGARKHIGKVCVQIE
jgi:hypothetical protein